MGRPLILSLFPGVDLLGHAFEMEMPEACLVRGPDLIYGSLSDVRTFHPPADVFDGVIGGAPCQSFSSLVHLVRAHGYEPKFGNLIPEFERCVFEAQPAWFVMENVPAAPAPVVEGYQVHTQILNNRWMPGAPEQNRVRRISFGTRDGRKLLVDVTALEAPIEYQAQGGDNSGSAYYARKSTAVVGSLDPVPVKMLKGGKLKRSVAAAVTSSDGGGTVKMARYTLADACELQGVPRDFLDDAPFTAQGKLKAVANGVPIWMGRAIAAAVKRAMEGSMDEKIEELVDVVAVNRETGVIKILGRDKTQRNADAIVAMAVMRRPPGQEFVFDTPPGLYQDGDLWEDE